MPLADAAVGTKPRAPGEVVREAQAAVRLEHRPRAVRSSPAEQSSPAAFAHRRRRVPGLHRVTASTSPSTKEHQAICLSDLSSRRLFVAAVLKPRSAAGPEPDGSTPRRIPGSTRDRAQCSRVAPTLAVGRRFQQSGQEANDEAPAHRHGASVDLATSAVAAHVVCATRLGCRRCRARRRWAGRRASRSAHGSARGRP